jgi:hypothetical protein
VDEAKVHAVIATWTDEGPYPTYHRKAQDFLRNAWPVLAMSLLRLVDEMQGDEELCVASESKMSIQTVMLDW